MLGTTIAACPGHDRISQRDDYRIADKRDVPSQPIPQATRSSEFIWDRSLSRDTLHKESPEFNPSLGTRGKSPGSTRGKSPGKLNTLTCMADSQWVAGYA